MKIICDSCGAKYTVSDDKVEGKTVKVKCRKCSAVIVVSNTGEISTAAGSGSEATYTVSVSDTDQRTMTMAEIIVAYNEGVIDAETFIWAEGMSDWQPLKDIDSVVDALHEAAEEAEAEEAATEAPDLGSTVAMTDGYNAEALLAASPGAVASMGIGGGNGSAATVSSGYGASPAVAARSDISFGSSSSFLDSGSNGDGGLSSQKAEENSAIFSLNMLTAKAGAPSSSSNFSEAEDSGLIDLKALAAGMGGGGGGAITDVAGGGVFPLGAPPPMVAQAPSEAPPAPSSSNRGLIIGLGGAVALLTAALVFFLTKDSGETVAKPESTAPAVVTVVVTKSVEVVKPTDETSTDKPAASAEATATAKTKVAPTATTRRTTPVNTGGRTTPTPTATTPRKSGGCNCAPSDLMCQMQCAQK